MLYVCGSPGHTCFIILIYFEQVFFLSNMIYILQATTKQCKNEGQHNKRLQHTH